jgi:hypothetical protein
VLPPVDMSIVVVGVASDGEGRGRGNGCSLVFGVVLVSFEVDASVEVLVFCEFDASGVFEDDMVQVDEKFSDWSGRR